MERNIDTIKWNPNQLEEQVFIGPQEDLIRSINDFNSYAGTNIGVTKTFRWSRGSYDQVKNAINRAMGFNKKNSGMYYIFNRIDDGRWSISRIKEKLNNIETMKCNLSSNNLGWQDNKGIVKEAVNYILAKFKSFDRKLIEEMYGIKIVITYNDDLTTNNFGEPVLYINFIKKDYDMTIYNYIEEGRESSEDFLCNLPVKGEVIFTIHYPFYKLLNYICKAIDNLNNSSNLNVGLDEYIDQIYTNRISYLISGTFFNVWDTKFPFIRDANKVKSYACPGDLLSRFEGPAQKFDLDSLTHYVNQWMSKFVLTRTNPLNHLNKLFHGKPKYFSESPLSNYIGSTTEDRCTYGNQQYHRPTDDHLYCDEEECTLRDICRWYYMLNPGERQGQLDQLCYLTHDLLTNKYNYNEFTLDDFRSAINLYNNPADRGLHINIKTLENLYGMLLNGGQKIKRKLLLFDMGRLMWQYRKTSFIHRMIDHYNHIGEIDRFENYFIDDHVYYSNDEIITMADRMDFTPYIDDIDLSDFIGNNILDVRHSILLEDNQDRIRRENQQEIQTPSDDLPGPEWDNFLARHPNSIEVSIR